MWKRVLCLCLTFVVLFGEERSFLGHAFAQTVKGKDDENAFNISGNANEIKGKEANKDQSTSNVQEAGQGEEINKDQETSNAQEAGQGEEINKDQGTSNAQEAGQGEEINKDQGTSNAQEAGQGEEINQNQEINQGQEAGQGEEINQNQEINQGQEVDKDQEANKDQEVDKEESALNAKNVDENKLQTKNLNQEKVEATDAKEDTKEENLWTLEKESFAKIVADHSIFALVNAKEAYKIRSASNDNANVVYNLPVGYQIRLLFVEIIDGQVWYYAEFAVNDVISRGYITNNVVVSVDTEFLEWKEIYGIDGIKRTGETDDMVVQNTTGTDLLAFPESYRSYLKTLITAHPNWTFIPFQTGLDWNTVIANEMVPTRNLVSKDAMLAWKDPSGYNPDTGEWGGQSGGAWVQATESVVKHFIDPRNSLNETSVFQFELLSYFNKSVHIKSGVEKALNGTFMGNKVLEDGSGGGKTYAQVLMDVGKDQSVSPYALASRLRQEQGASMGDLASGTYPGFAGLYNYYNIGAFGDTREEVVANGLTEARNEGWTTRYLALYGGATKAAEQYIKHGQDTLYLQKFDVDGSYNGTFWHQYMQNLTAADSEGKTMKSAYVEIGKLDSPIKFRVPIYLNMPAKAYPMPQDTLSKPKISKITKNNTTTITVSWGEISGATEYQVWRATSKNGTYTKLKTVKGLASTSYKDKKAIPGKAYYYKIRACSTNYKGIYGITVQSPYSAIKSKDMATPTVNFEKVKRKNYTTTNLTWKKNSNVTGYRIYRRVGTTGKYKSLKIIRNNKTTTYADTTMQPNNLYYYKIRSYITIDGKTYYSAYSPEKKINNKTKALSTVSVKRKGYTAVKLTWKKPEKTYYYKVQFYVTINGKRYYSPFTKEKKINNKTKALSTVSVKRKGYTAVKLTWKKPSSATGYRIRRKEGASGTYKLIKTVKDGSTTAYTDKNIIPEQTYYYKVQFYVTVNGKRYYSPFTKEKKINNKTKALSTVSVKRKDDTAAQLTWKRPSSATGYRIRRKEGANGTYQLIKTVKDASTTAYIDKRIVPEQTYYYKVQFYVTVNGKRYYSPFAKVKKIKSH
ncbi:hypothetical protein LQZ18_18460 [Lachnospiraceae bacterium ZAX-1]